MEKQKVKSVKNGMDEMRAAFNKQKAREGGGKAGGKDTYLKLAVGRNKVRFLPIDDTELFYVAAPQHFGVGPMAKSVRCIGIFDERDNPALGTKCPICKQFTLELAKVNKRYERGSEQARKAFGELRSKYGHKVRYFSNVVQEDGAVKVLGYGPQIFEQVLAYYFGEDSDYGPVMDLKEGRWFNVKRIGEGRNTEYKVLLDDRPTRLRDSSKALAARHDLEAEAGPILTPDEIKQIMNGGFEDEELEEH